MALGFFDSGVGGLSILRKVWQILPKEDLIYLADQVNCPYGDKTTEEIRKLTVKGVEFLLDKSCKLIIVACNTATTNAIGFLRNKFPKSLFVGVVPVIKPASKLSKTGHLAIVSTSATSRSQNFQQLIDQFTWGKKVYSLTCPGLVELIEDGIISGKLVQQRLRACLEPATKDSLVDVVVMGCTHYPFIYSEIASFFKKKVKFIESSKPVAKQAKRLLEQNNLESNGIMTAKTFFFTTGNAQKFSKVASKLLKRRIIAQRVDL